MNNPQASAHAALATALMATERARKELFDDRMDRDTNLGDGNDPSERSTAHIDHAIDDLEDALRALTTGHDVDEPGNPYADAPHLDGLG